MAFIELGGIQFFRRLSTEKAAPGRVVDLVVHRFTQRLSRQSAAYFYPLVEFSLPGGQQKVVELSEGSWPPAYKTGDAVTVLYDPDQPENARINSFSSLLVALAKAAQVRK